MGNLNRPYKLFKYETIAMASPENVSNHLDNLEKVSTPAIILSNRYQVLSVLGDGGFGKTFLVEDIQMPSNRRCVLKQLKPIHDETPELRQMVQDRFQREAATLETLGEAHDQIPRLYAYFSEANQFYLVEEWVEGMTVTQKVQQAGPQNEATVQTMIANLLPAIAYIHSRGIVHRDIKPDNIILRSRDGKPVLIDFGAVKETMTTVINSQAHSTRSIVVGTPGYMPAEQLSGRPVYASDLYGLGMSAIYMLTGKLPQEIAIDPQTGQLRWREHAPATSAGFGNFLDCATHISIQSRFANAQDMQSILNSLMMSQMTTQALPLSPSSTTLSSAPFSSSQSSVNTAVVAPSFTTITQPHSGTRSQPILASEASSQWKSAVIIGGMVGLSVLLGSVFLTNKILAPSGISSSEKEQGSNPDNLESVEALTTPESNREPTSIAPSANASSSSSVEEPSPQQAETPSDSPETTASLFPTAQRDAMPQPDDEDGNYFSSDGWETWRILSREQHCLSTPNSVPSNQAPTLKSGESIYVNISENRSAATDSDGKPWFRVESSLGSCYVRARSNYIAPKNISTTNDIPKVMPQPDDEDGNYFSSDGWETWRILSREQYCLSTPNSVPSNQAPTLKSGESIYVNISENRSAATDSDGKPWFRVESSLGSCYVRARSKYITPDS